MENTYTSPTSFKPFLWGITLVICFIALLLTLLRVDTYMKNQAIHDCGSISKFEQTLPENIKVTYPVQDIYKDCLKQKGL